MNLLLTLKFSFYYISDPILQSVQLSYIFVIIGPCVHVALAVIPVRLRKGRPRKKSQSLLQKHPFYLTKSFLVL